jgi:hypothetical protein
MSDALQPIKNATQIDEEINFTINFPHDPNDAVLISLFFALPVNPLSLTN